jgi:ubiquinone/menaquinone biosynthesis C-methylase UbiE
MANYTETADIETATAGYAARFAGPVGQYFLDRQAAITMDLLADTPASTVLDVGGGHAQMVGPLAHLGFVMTVTGSADSCGVALATRVMPEEVEYLTCDSLNLPFEDNSFDVVLSFRLLPHVKQWQALIAELCRVADKSVIVDYADKRSSNILYSTLFSLKQKLEGNTRPFTLYTRSQISDEFIKNGFSAPCFKPKFLLPMVVHRKLNSRAFSSVVEMIFRCTGLTYLFGSPVILRSDRLET